MSDAIVPADPVGALVAILKAVPQLNGVGVFGGELPEAEAAGMPRKAIVLRPSGGISLTGGSSVEHDTQRIDVFCYGATPNEAAQLDPLVALIFRRIARVVSVGTLIHWVNSAGGFSTARDPDTDWPRVFRSYQVFHALESIS